MYCKNSIFWSDQACVRALDCQYDIVGAINIVQVHTRTIFIAFWCAAIACIVTKLENKGPTSGSRINPSADVSAGVPFW